MKLLLCMLCITNALAIDNQWWKHSTIYEIYTPSFMDSNGDGWGDLKGIISKLDYLKDLRVDVIWLTPYHPSPMRDTGYDVSNYLDINPLFGSLNDFDELIRELNKRDMKFIMDFVLNHSSDKHEWFEKSVKQIHPYTNYYIWRDPKSFDEYGNPSPPNNWSTYFGGCAWQWNDERKQYYYHVFLPEQPDLNYRNPLVKKEIEKIIKFWLDRGVAGMRLDAIDDLFEDESLAENGTTLKHPDTYEYLRELRAYVDRLNTEYNTFERILIGEAWGDSNELRAIYGNETHSACHFPFNFLLSDNMEYKNAADLHSMVNYWMNLTPNNSAANWLIDTHDRNRSSFICAQEYVNVLHTLILTLPGVTTLYYGGEIDMTFGILRPHQVWLTSEYARTPMQWNSSPNGGFSTSQETWLDVNPNYARLNVENYKADPNSTYHYLKELLKLKKTDTMRYGLLHTYTISEWVFAFTRSYDGIEDCIIVLNTNAEQEQVRLQSKIPFLPPVLKVRLASFNSGYKKGMAITFKRRRSFVMNPMSAVIFCHEYDNNNASHQHDNVPKNAQ